MPQITNAVYTPETPGIELPPEWISAGPATNGASTQPKISSDGRFVVFSSAAALLNTDTDSASDVYLLDRNTGVVTHVSQQSEGGTIEGASDPVISANGRYIAYATGMATIWLYDAQNITHQQVFAGDGSVSSVGSLGVDDEGNVLFHSLSGSSQADPFDVQLYNNESNSLLVISDGVDGGGSKDAQASADGRYFVYTSENGGGQNANGTNVFVYDKITQTTTNLSDTLPRAGGETFHNAHGAQISADGRWVYFNANPQGHDEVFIWDRLNPSTPISISEAAAPTGSVFGSGLLDITPDGEFAVFYSVNDGLVDGDNDGAADLFLYQLSTGAITRIGAVDNELAGVPVRAQISNDGSFVLFNTPISLTGSDTNGVTDLYVWERASETLTLASSDGGDMGDMTPDGSSIVFRTPEALDASDTNGVHDIYLTSFQERLKNQAIEDGRHLAFDLTVRNTTNIMVVWGDGITTTRSLDGSAQTVRLSHSYPAGFGDTTQGTITLTGPDGSVTYNLGAQNWYGDGAPTIDFTEGNDLVFSTRPTDQPYGGGGNDLLFGSSVREQIMGAEGGDHLFGLGGDDLLFGGTFDGDDQLGDDTLDGGTGADTMAGGGGDDIYYVDDANDVVLEYGVAGSGTDTVITSVDYAFGMKTKLKYDGTESVDTSVQHVEIIRAADGAAGIDITGTKIANMIFGNAGTNILQGGGGTDTLTGLDGSDTYYVDSIADKVIEGATGDTDSVIASADWVLGAKSQVEVLKTISQTGTTGIDLTGNELANSITGNAGINILKGMAGADTLIGGKGADRLYAGTDLAQDSFVYTARTDSGVTSTTWDKIYQFDRKISTTDKAHDRINLSALDADNEMVGNQAFRWMGTAFKSVASAGSTVEGQVRIEDLGADVKVHIDLDGNSTTDMILFVVGVSTMTKGDFVL